ncbi:Ig-like domain-containing protein [Methanobrevibacter sp.]
MVLVRKYVRSLDEIRYPNILDRVDWTDKRYAINGNTTQETYSLYVEKKAYVKSENKWVKNIPETLGARDFDLDIPKDAKINSVTFNVVMRASKGLEVLKPICRFMIYGGKGKVEELHFTKPAIGIEGWIGGIYNIVPSTNIPTQTQTVQYTLTGDLWDQRKYPSTALNDPLMGIDLQFREAYKCLKESPIYINSIYVEVDYTPSETTISFNPSETTYDNPYSVLANKEFQLDISFKQNVANLGRRTFDIDIPWGTEIISWSATSGTFNPNTRKYTVDLSPNSENVLSLTLNPHGVGIKELKVYNDDLSSSFYYYPTILYDTDYFTANIISNSVRKNNRSCFTYNIQSETLESMQSFLLTFSHDGAYTDVQYLSVSVDEELSSDGVRLTESTEVSQIVKLSDGRYRVRLDVPSDVTNTIVLNFCCYPKVTGEFTATITDESLNETYSHSFQSLEPYIYRLGDYDNITSAYYNLKCISDDIVFVDHRIPSEIAPYEDTVFLACEFDEVDSVMTMSESSLTAHFYEAIDYIGCVPLEQTHFNPKSTYKDKLLDSRYKNKRYMGKQLASDEDITLNVRLHPHQVTTIQGLIDMDKPIPINTNHKCFEGDSLNNRGWAEIYGVKTEQTGNNPHWYKCDIDVKYITHNLDTRFNIHRGVKSYPFDIPDMLIPVNEYSDDLSKFFNIKTDGTYEYRADYQILDTDPPVMVNFDDNKRNKFELDSGQSLFIQTKDTLVNRCDVSVDWISSKLAEDKENQITRIFRIRDKRSNQVVFEYEYCDWDMSDTNYIGATIKGRQLHKGSYDPLAINRTIDVRREDMSDVNLNTGEVILDDSEVYFGSTTHFQIKNKMLTIIEEGFNGKELSYVATNPLEGSSYLFEVEIQNNNTDAETDDVIFYLNIEVTETLLDTARFSEYYDHMVVSPFPVADRKVLFIRRAEEGNIYYLEDDDLKEFSYVIDPYYQYKNGVDLQSDDGISIFNLNYAYEMIYVQNGLVRLGINRVNGSIILAKYDVTSGEYIITSRFKLSNEKDVGITYISDDKIVLHAGDSKFTMWRGHPYVMINHNGEDIIILNNYSRVWAESVGDDVNEFPVYYDLMNSRNLLPSNIGGNLISAKDIEVSETEVAHLDLSISTNTNPIYTNEDIVLDITGTINSFSEDILVEDGYSYNGTLGTYSSEVQVNHGYVYGVDAMIEKEVIVKDESVNVSGFVYDYNHVGISGKLVNIYSSNYISLSDQAISSDYNPNWFNQSNRLTVTRNTGGTTLSNTSGSNGFFLASNEPINTIANAIQWDNHSIVEFQLVNAPNTGSYIQFYDGTTTVQKDMVELGAIQSKRVKVEITDENIIFSVDGNVTSTVPNTLTGQIRIGFRIDNNSTFRFANFKITESTKLIGSGVTDSNGEYQISLTGQGNGSKEIWSTFSNLTSTRQTLYDSQFYDGGVINNYMNEWYYVSSRFNIERTNEYTSLTNISSENGLYCANKVNTSKSNYEDVKEWYNPFHIAFEVVDYYGTVYLQFYDGTTTARRSFDSLNITNGSQVVIDYDGSVMHYNVDGVTYTRNIALINPSRIEFRIEPESNLKYKDFIIWDSVEVPISKTLSFIVNKSILSKAHNDSCTLTATYRESNVGVQGKTVEFKANGEIIGTGTTNANGIATYTYTATGLGDISFTANVGKLVSKEYNVEDCIYYDTTEYSQTTSGDALYQKLNDIEFELPLSYIWSVDAKVSSTSGSEDRLFLTPTNFDGQQPPYSIFFDIAGSDANGGIRNNSSTYKGDLGKVKAIADAYNTFSLVKSNDVLTYTVDETEIGSIETDIFNEYTTWWFAYSLWKRPSITYTWRNMKIKAL